MRKIGFGLLSLVLMSFAIQTNAQDTSHEAIVTKDSAFHYPKDSLSAYEFYPRQHPPEGFLENDFAFGGTAGTPGGLNFIAEKYFNQLGVRAEFGAFGLVPFFLISGYQADLCCVLLRDKNELMECTVFYSNTFTSRDRKSTRLNSSH